MLTFAGAGFCAWRHGPAGKVAPRAELGGVGWEELPPPPTLVGSEPEKVSDTLLAPVYSPPRGAGAAGTQVQVGQQGDTCGWVLGFGTDLDQKGTGPPLVALALSTQGLALVKVRGSLKPPPRPQSPTAENLGSTSPHPQPREAAAGRRDALPRAQLLADYVGSTSAKSDSPGAPQAWSSRWPGASGSL